MAVLGVKFWETTSRAAAILWTRQGAGIAVAQAVDFGIAPLSDYHVAGIDFDTVRPAPTLPAVPQGMWVRFAMNFMSIMCRL